MGSTTTDSIDFLTEKPAKNLKLQTKCGLKLKAAALKRAADLGLDESKYLRRLVVDDIEKSRNN